MGLINDALKGQIAQTNLEIITAKTDGINILNQGLNETNKRNSEIGEKLGSAQIQNIQLINQLNSIQRELNTEKEKNKKLKQEVEIYRQLLCKPLSAIAENNDNFKKNYEEQMQIMADWMVSQKAFKELAIEFGLEKGLKLEGIIQMGNKKELDVLNDKHDPSHNTNVGDSTIIGPRRNNLIAKIK
jgi:predicted nuclease with TOPRIM domain